jgi:hypothetical protein
MDGGGFHTSVLDHQSKAGTMRQPAAALGEQGPQGQQGQQETEQETEQEQEQRAKSSQRRSSTSRVYEARLHGVPGLSTLTSDHSPPLPTTTPQAAAIPPSRHY